MFTCPTARRKRGSRGGGGGRWGCTLVNYGEGCAAKGLQPWFYDWSKISNIFEAHILKRTVFKEKENSKDSMNVSTLFCFCNRWKVTNSSVLTDYTVYVLHSACHLHTAIVADSIYIQFTLLKNHSGSQCKQEQKWYPIWGSKPQKPNPITRHIPI